MLAELVVDFMREVAGIHKRLVADSLDRMGDVGLVSLAADENASILDVSGNIVADFFFWTKFQEALARIELNMGVPRTVEAFQTEKQPSHTAFHESELQVGKLVKNTVEDHTAEGDHLAKRMAQRVNRRIGGQVVEPQILMGAAVNADSAAKPVGFFIDGPVTFI